MPSRVAGRNGLRRITQQKENEIFLPIDGEFRKLSVAFTLPEGESSDSIFGKIER